MILIANLITADDDYDIIIVLNVRLGKFILLNKFQ